MNQLNVSLQHAITTLAAKGWSARMIARGLGVHRETVIRYLQSVVAASRPAIPRTGSEAASVAKFTKPVHVPIGSTAGRASQCAPLTAVIEHGLLAGLSARRFYQDLVAGHGFTDGYEAVKRFARQLPHRTELPFRQMECAPGHEMRVDFGQGAWVLSDGQRCRPQLFRVGLSHSRKS